jgi:hypothetical protein
MNYETNKNPTQAFPITSQFWVFRLRFAKPDIIHKGKCVQRLLNY